MTSGPDGSWQRRYEAAKVRDEEGKGLWLVVILRFRAWGAATLRGRQGASRR